MHRLYLTVFLVQITEAAARKIDASIAQSRAASDRSVRDEDFSLRGTNSYAAPMESLTLRKRHAEEIHELQETYKRQLKEYEDQNKYLWYSTTKKLSEDLTNIEEKYTHRLKYDTVCPEVETSVERCYSQNRKQPLKCSQLVKEFVGCVRDARFKALTNL